MLRGWAARKIFRGKLEVAHPFSSVGHAFKGSNFLEDRALYGLLLETAALPNGIEVISPSSLLETEVIAGTGIALRAIKALIRAL